GSHSGAGLDRRRAGVPAHASGETACPARYGRWWFDRGTAAPHRTSAVRPAGCAAALRPEASPRCATGTLAPDWPRQSHNLISTEESREPDPTLGRTGPR